MDYPDFNLRLAKKLKPLGIPIVYYISPQVWAWRKSRIQDIKKLVDKMLVLLPFEKEFYKQHGVNVEFVGHPLLDELTPQLFARDERDRSRSRYGVLENELLVGLMPGSRKSELAHHLATQIQVAEKLYAGNNKLKFALLVAPTFSLEEVRKLTPYFSVPLIFLKDDPLKMVSLTDIILCASGTATLIVGLMKKPMVIMYKMNPFSAFLAKLFVRGTAHFGLINLVLGKRAVPELFQEQASVDNLSSEIARLIQNVVEREQMAIELAHSHEVLGSRGATHRVAEILNQMMF